MRVDADWYGLGVKRILFATALSTFVLPVLSSPGTGSAAVPNNGWPSCTTETQVECVESLSYTTVAGTFTAVDPGGELPAGAPMVQRTDPYVTVLGANPANPMTMVNFTVHPPRSNSLAPNVLAGLDEGTYSFVIRLGSYDPTQVGLSAEPISVSHSQRTDGSFSLSIVARPRPRVSVSSQASNDACKASAWMCDGEAATVRTISGWVFQNVIPANRPLFRGMWVATNASEASIPSVSTLMRSISVNLAGPHTVPAGFPTEGLTMENGKGLNPAFYKFYVPFSIIEAMLAMAPAEIRNTLTPAMVKARISEAAAQREQPVTLTMGESGMLVDLGLLHYSAPNPEVTFYTPAQLAAQAAAPSASAGQTKSFVVGKKYLPGSLTSVPSGYRVSRIVIGSASRSICSAMGTRILVRKKGTCSFTLSVQRGKITKSVKGKTRVG